MAGASPARTHQLLDRSLRRRAGSSGKGGEEVAVLTLAGQGVLPWPGMRNTGGCIMEISGGECEIVIGRS